MPADQDRMPRKLRVLVVGPLAHQKAGHHVTFPKYLAMGLQEAGAEVTLLFPQPLRIPLSAAEARMPSICLRERLPASPWWWRQLWPRLAERPILLCALWIAWNVRRTDYNLIYWADLEYDYPAILLLTRLRLWRFTTGFTHHQPIEAGASSAGQLCELHDRLARRNIKLTMCVMSQDLLDGMRASFGRPSLGVYVPHGANFRPLSTRDRNAARHTLGLPLEARILLVFGMQSPVKNLDLLARVLRRSSFSSPLCVIFAGTHDPTWQHPFVEFAPLHPKSNISTIINAGFISDEVTQSLFAAADAVWCYYKDFKGASGVTMQAFGFGRMTLGVDQDEIGAMTRDIGAGILIAPNDPEALSAALTHFVEMVDATQTSYEAGARAVGARFSWANVGGSLLSVCVAPLSESSS